MSRKNRRSAPAPAPTPVAQLKDAAARKIAEMQERRDASGYVERHPRAAINTLGNQAIMAVRIIQTLVIDAAHNYGVRKLLDLGSSCIYPKLAPQPMTEDCLLTSALEPSNEWYALAKIAGLKFCQALHRQHGFAAISLMPTNIYGPGDNFDLKSSHVLPAMLRKFHDAKVAGAPEVVLWGTGTPKREFLYVDDLADACLFALQYYQGEQFLNVGTGEDLAIRELAEMVAREVGYPGLITWDTTMPDGTPRKLLDLSRLTALGWKAKTTLADGIRQTYRWYIENMTAVQPG